MEFTMEHEPDLTLPEDSIHRARLQEIKPRTFSWTDSKTGEKKESETIDWWWEITTTSFGAEYVGRRVKGECNAKLSDRGGNRFKDWAQVLLQREIPVGMKIDTDDLVGLEAEIVIGHRQDKKDPAKVWEFVSDVAPVDGGYVNNEPPF